MIFFEFYHKRMLVVFFNKLIFNFIWCFFGKIFFKKKNEGCISL